MQLQGEILKTYTTPTEGQIHDYSSQIHQIDIMVTLGKLTQLDLKMFARWNKFLEKHSHYLF